MTRVHLVGVSWGGKLALWAYLHGFDAVQSVSLIAPGLFPRVDVSLAEKLRIAAAAMWHPDRRFAIPLNEPELFTANPTRQQFISEDPLRLRETGAGFFAASRWMDGARRRLKRTASCPLHVFLAEHDRIIDNPSTLQWVRRLGWNESKVTLYEGAHHTLEFESDPRPFFEDLAECLERAD